MIDEKAIDDIVTATRQANMINDDISTVIISDDNIKSFILAIIATYLSLTRENTND
ncbi:MAG: hypothetical protein GY796_35515 [Chloroflexi bacterium]|nr:hypothetical protein [Chloroflexota bacterium]